MDPPNDDGIEIPLSEVGLQGRSSEEKTPPDKENTSILSNMEILLSRIVAAQQPIPTGVNAVQLIHFNRYDADVDVDGWCRVSEMIIKSKKLERVALLIALTTSLKGRAASCLTKLPLDQLSWELLKQTLCAKFAKPKLIQDYFDENMRFQIGIKAHGPAVDS